MAEKLIKYYLRGHIENGPAWTNQAAVYMADHVDKREKEYKAEIAEQKEHIAEEAEAEIERLKEALADEQRHRCREGKARAEEIKGWDNLATGDVHEIDRLKKEVKAREAKIHDLLEFQEGLERMIAAYKDQVKDAAIALAEKKAEIERLKEALDGEQRHALRERKMAVEAEGKLEACEQHNKILCESIKESNTEVERLKEEGCLDRAAKNVACDYYREAEAKLKITVRALQAIQRRHGPDNEVDVFDAAGMYKSACTALTDIEKPDEPLFTAPLTGERIHERTPFLDKANEKLHRPCTCWRCEEQLPLKQVSPQNADIRVDKSLVEEDGGKPDDKDIHTSQQVWSNKATLEFNLTDPEGRERFTVASKAEDLRMALHDISTHLRSLNKHSDSDDTNIEDMLSFFWDTLNNHTITLEEMS